MRPRNQVSNYENADNLSNLQNLPRVQTVTNLPVITATRTSDGKSAEFEFSDNRIHTNIKLQHITENLERNHFRSHMLETYLQK